MITRCDGLVGKLHYSYGEFYTRADCVNLDKGLANRPIT
jgi:hypothetical protein